MITTTIRDILGDRPLLSVAPDATLDAAARIMATHRVGAVAVMEADRLVGILSERDIVFRGVAQGLPMAETQVDQIMTRDPVTIDIGNAISQALLAKLGDQFRHLPVTENSRAVGVLSYRDIPAEYVMMFERFREMRAPQTDDPA